MKQTRPHFLFHVPLAAVVVALLFSAAETLAGTFILNDIEEASAVQARAEAAQFLSYATFGPTVEEINSLAARITDTGRDKAFEEWIDGQFAVPATYHKALARQMVVDDDFAPGQEGIDVYRYRDYAWWHTAIAAKDQLRQRTAWALSQIFVVNNTGSGFNGEEIDGSGESRWLGLPDYYDVLVRNAFGNYRDALGEVTLHPVMGVFLSHVNNSKGDRSLGLFPDENYAREVMQLFSIGLYELTSTGAVKTDSAGNYIETYDNEDIESFARVFTGLTYAGEYKFRASKNLNQPMQMIEEEHDTGEKSLLNRTVLPAGQGGMQDIQAALDNLFYHDNAGPFIAHRLIQRLVKSNPSGNYINRVTQAFNDNGDGVRGDFRAVIKAILLDPEVWRSQTYDLSPTLPGLRVGAGGAALTRLREPVLRYTAFIRAFNPASDHHTGRFLVPSLYSTLNQAPYKAPSVFNFYRPDYQPFPGEVLTARSSRRSVPEVNTASAVQGEGLSLGGYDNSVEQMVTGTSVPVVDLPDDSAGDDLSLGGYDNSLARLTGEAGDRPAVASSRITREDSPSGRASDSRFAAPEFQILTSPAMNKFANLLRWNVDDAVATYTLRDNALLGKVESRISFDFTRESELAKDPAALVAHLDLLLCHGTMDDTVKQIIQDEITNQTTDNLLRAKGAILATLTSSECSVSN